MIVIAALLSAAAPVATKPSLVEADAQAVERAATAVAPHIDGTWLDGRPGTDRLVEAQWRTVQRWATDWLDANPRANPKALIKAGARFGDEWSMSAATLGGGDMLVGVSASYGRMGTAFILGSNAAGVHRVRWSTATPQKPLDSEADRALLLWRPTAQNERCSNDCRMVGWNSVGRLPDSADGAKRFWIEATYAQDIGATVGKQLSLWSWRDGRARPVLVRDYAVMVDQTGSVLRGAILHLRSKRSWDSLSACGSCFGRETNLRFAIGPRRVRELPPVSLTPEIDVVDRVFSRVLVGRSASALASRSALRVIRMQLADSFAETDSQLRSAAGMVMGWGRWNVHGVRWACLNVEGVGATAFAFDRQRHRVTAAHVLASNGCSGKGTRM
jgi:hypothetical protein